MASFCSTSDVFQCLVLQNIFQLFLERSTTIAVPRTLETSCSLFRKKKKHLSAVELNIRAYRHNLVDKSWAGEEGGNRPWGNLLNSQVRKRGKIDLNQPLIYIHPLPPLLPQFLYIPIFMSGAKKLFLRKILGGGRYLPPLTPQVSPVYELVSDFMQASTGSGEIESEVFCLRPNGDSDLN